MEQEKKINISRLYLFPLNNRYYSYLYFRRSLVIKKRR